MQLDWGQCVALLQIAGWRCMKELMQQILKIKNLSYKNLAAEAKAGVVAGGAGSTVRAPLLDH